MRRSCSSVDSARPYSVNSGASWIGMMDFDEILRSLPHAFPFRVIDQILDIEKGKRAIALKNVSMDEPYFLGHFPKEPMMPGVLILEAMAQTGGLAFESSFEKGEEGVPVLASIEEFRLKKRVIPEINSSSKQKSCVYFLTWPR